MNEMISIKQAVQFSGLSENYIRKAIAAGKLTTVKQFIGETKIEKNWIDAAEFESWRATAGAHSKREDGRNKFVIYMTADEMERLTSLLHEDAFELPIARANVKSSAE